MRSNSWDIYFSVVFGVSILFAIGFFLALIVSSTKRSMDYATKPLFERIDQLEQMSKESNKNIELVANEVPVYQVENNSITKFKDLIR